MFRVTNFLKNTHFRPMSPSLNGVPNGLNEYDSLPMDMSMNTQMQHILPIDANIDDEHKLIARYAAKLAGRTEVAFQFSIRT